MDDLFPLDRVQAVLQEYAQAVQSVYRQRLEASGRRATGQLIASVRCRVESGDRAFEVTMTLEDWWKYVEYDTRPHWPPRDAILKWIRVKPVIPRPDGRGRIPTERQLAYLISRKIARVGTEGSHDLRNTLEQVNADYLPRLQAALAEDAAGYLSRIIASSY